MEHNMRVKDGERVVDKIYKVIDLFLSRKSVTTDDIAEYTGMSKRSAQRYMKDAMENLDIKKNDDGSYTLLNKDNTYSIVKRNNSFLTTTLLQYAKTFFPENRYDVIENFYSIFKLKNMSSFIQVVESSSLDYAKIESIVEELDHYIRYPKLKIQFHYAKDKKTKITNPYKILYYNGFWYLIGFTNNEEVRTYRIDYISDISLTGEKIIEISEKSKNMVDNTSTIWFGEEETMVEILLDDCIKEYFIERPILKNMVIKSESPFIIEVPVYNSMALYMDLMPYTPYFEIKTKKVRKYFRERMEWGLSRHQ